MFNLLLVQTNLSCNMHCKMCALPSYANPQKRWTIKELRKATKGLKGKINCIVISGGEPTIRKDISEVCNLLASLEPRWIVLCSNGFETERLMSLVDQLTASKSLFGVSLSLDGTKDVHDKIRIEGSFDRVIKSVKLLKKRNIKTDIAMCSQPLNYHQTYQVFSLVHKMGAYFNTTIAQPFKHYEWTEAMLCVLEEQLRRVVKEQPPEEEMMEWSNYYLANLVSHFRSGKRPIPCTAGTSLIMLDPFGDIYPCFKAPWNKKRGYGNPELSFGNIKKDGSIISIFESPKANEVREKIDAPNCNLCWGVCDALSDKI